MWFSASDSRVSACAPGFWKNVGVTTDVCTACTTDTNAAADATYTCGFKTSDSKGECLCPWILEKCRRNIRRMYNLYN